MPEPDYLEPDEFKKIRNERGVSYATYEAMIESLPATFIPSLLKKMVQTAHDKNVFKHGKIKTFVAAVESDLEK